jgi:hypothetical protein
MGGDATVQESVRTLAELPRPRPVSVNAISKMPVRSLKLVAASRPA